MCPIKGPGESLAIITSPYFVAGCIIEGGIVIRSVPIIWKISNQKTLSFLREHCQKRGWRLDIIDQ